MGEGCRLDRQDNRRWRVADWTDRTTEGGGLQTGQTGQQKVEGCRLDRQDNRMGEGCRLDRQDNRRWRVADWTDRTTEGGGLQTGQTGQQNGGVTGT